MNGHDESPFILVDTDVLIDGGRRIMDALACLEQIEHRFTPAASAVTRMEMIAGCQKKRDQRAVQRFPRRFHIVEMDEHISRVATELLLRYRLSHGRLLADALISATGISSNMPFVSKYQRDYRFIAGLDPRPHPRPFATPARQQQ